MTIDEAIKHCLEVAEENDLAAGTYEILAENKHNVYEKLTAETNSSRCAECAADHRQLAEWLKELKEAKRLLRLAVKDITFILSYTCSHDVMSCKECPTENGACDKWRYADEALKLIGGADDELIQGGTK